MLPVSLDCVVFLLCLSSSCVLYVASFSALFIFDRPFGILLRLFDKKKHIFDLVDKLRWNDAVKTKDNNLRL
jgi:hypothetical protein